MLNTVKKWLLILLPLCLVIFIVLQFWSFLFKTRIVGEVVAVERVQAPAVILTNPQGQMNQQVFSFSVAIKDLKTGEIHMASSEDRQWAAVTKGNCVIAAYFPYPPWRMLDKGMTNHNARLLRNFTSCDQIPLESGFWSWLKFFFMVG